MDNLNFDWPLGFGMKSLGGGDHRLGSISQIGSLGDTSDDVEVTQQYEIISDLLCISYSYPRWPVHVKH